ncbi:MAG: DNA polymerase III subunit gamma/tau [Desulfobacula sp.]|jgi:DNA polymerase-3 subunit gamma/tau
MSYQVLALKYRPQTFDDVIGQNHVTTTLKNAISSDRVAHAILFTGPRGTGKTTIARILAKAMNCKNGPSAFPCNNCRICKEIIEGHCTDVFEIDGASNNSVDQIRDLRENVTYMPSSAKYKIYIIDEVHMLSTAAFNALLKTLEEPPDHVMFIFATTEVHKIPSTILSRCQRHDLTRVPVELISGHLSLLCEKEGFLIRNESIELISREADGSIRDGLSLLDRILSSSAKKEIDPDWVLNALGAIDHRLMHDICSAIFKKNGAELLEIIEKVNDSGIDLKKFYADIILYFRNFSVILLCGKDSSAVNISGSEKALIFQFQASAGVPIEHVQAILQILLKEENIVRYSSHTRIAIEMVLLKLLHLDSGARIDYMIHQLDVIAGQINSMDAGFEESSVPLPKPESFSPLKGEESPPMTEKKPAAYRDSSSDHNMSEKPAAIPEQKTWPNFLKKIEQTQPFIFALLTKGTVKKNSPEDIIVELDNCSSFDKQRIENKENELKQLCREYFGKTLTIKIELQNIKPIENLQKKNEIKVRQAALNHPLVVEAQRLFNGQIINS